MAKPARRRAKQKTENRAPQGGLGSRELGFALSLGFQRCLDLLHLRGWSSSVGSLGPSRLSTASKLLSRVLFSSTRALGPQEAGSGHYTHVFLFFVWGGRALTSERGGSPTGNNNNTNHSPTPGMLVRLHLLVPAAALLALLLHRSRLRTRRQRPASTACGSSAPPTTTTDASAVHYMLTSNQVRPRQCAAEAVARLPDAAVTTGKAGGLLRGVTLHAPATAVHTLATLALPERVYAVVAATPAAELLEAGADDTALLLLAQVEALVAAAPGWDAALCAHAILHPLAAAQTLGVGVLGVLATAAFQSSSVASRNS